MIYSNRIVPSLVLLLSLTVATLPAVLADKPLVCAKGFVMDKFCITNGVMIDNGLPTLKQPDQHSIHCLVDLSQCLASGYEILSTPLNANGEYTRTHQIDKTGETLFLAQARAAGSKTGSPACTTCVGGGTQVKGYQATFIGTENATTTPPTLMTMSVHPFDANCTALLDAAAMAVPTAAPVMETPMPTDSAANGLATMTAMLTVAASAVSMVLLG